VAKHPKIDPISVSTVRTRRAYFDCRFGQLHVRTAFPTTGGFDEGVTLFCLHPWEASSRSFDAFLPALAADRSVYAPDLPGRGESDPAPLESAIEAANAVSDLAADLRLRQIDVLGLRFGAEVALQLVATQPKLIRRMVLGGAPPMERLPRIEQESLVLRVRLGAADDSEWTKGVLPNAKFIDWDEYAGNVPGVASPALVQQIGAFLKAG
jgi:pimeloyl-ACP methyl ester carboxylesterase